MILTPGALCSLKGAILKPHILATCSRHDNLSLRHSITDDLHNYMQWCWCMVVVALVGFRDGRQLLARSGVSYGDRGRGARRPGCGCEIIGLTVHRRH